MLTVLHRHDDGSETLYCATVVTRERVEGDGPTAPAQPADVTLRGVPKGQEYGPGAIRLDNDMIVLRSGCRSSSGITPMAFVMNAHGATVARYTL